MNIFATSPCPEESARALDDKRVVKMMLESCQILSTIIGGPYKPTHRNHPVTRWAAQRQSHLWWTYQHAIALHAVYEETYGRRSEKISAALTQLRQDVHPTSTKPQHFQNSARRTDLQIDFTHLPVHEAYRRYLTQRWSLQSPAPRWTNRNRPYWLKMWDD